MISDMTCKVMVIMIIHENACFHACHFLEVIDNSCCRAVGSDRRGRTAAPEVTFGTVFCSVLALVTRSERFLSSKNTAFMVPLGFGITKTQVLELLF